MIQSSIIYLMMNFPWESASFCLLRITWPLSIIYFVEKYTLLLLQSCAVEWLHLGTFVKCYSSLSSLFCFRAFVLFSIGRKHVFLLRILLLVAVLSSENWLIFLVILDWPGTFQIVQMSLGHTVHQVTESHRFFFFFLSQISLSFSLSLLPVLVSFLEEW